MNVYRYKAVAKNGRTVDGIIEAYDEYEAVVLIKKDYQIVLKINEVNNDTKKINLNEALWISDKVLSMVSSQFSILLKAGLPIVRTVTLVAEQSTDKSMQKILKAVASDVAAGYGLAQSLQTHGEILPAVFIETIKAGEQAGTLELSFEKLTTYFSKSHKMKSKVKAALMYPAFLSTLAVVVISIVMVFTVPTLESTFKSFGNEMPLATKVLIAVARFMKDRWWIILLVLPRFYVSTSKSIIKALINIRSFKIQLSPIG